MSDAKQEELLQRAQNGDEAALQRLLFLHYDELQRRVEARLPNALRNSVGADDVVQESLRVAYRKISEFEMRGPKSFLAWLTQIAEFQVRDAAKKRRAIKHGGDRIQIAPEAQTESGSVVQILERLAFESQTPSRAAAREDNLVAVRKALTTLAPDQRTAVEARYLENLPVREIAARMGRTEGAIHQLLHRGLRQLQDAVGPFSDFFSRPG